jgi:hypothetical protein
MFKVLTTTGLLVLMILFPSSQVNCQDMPVGARSVSMAGITAGLEDIWATLNNPACLARIDHFALGTGLEQKFLMKETGQYALACNLPVNKGGLGFTGIFSGYREFVDQRIIAGFGRLFGNNFLAGISLVYCYQNAGNYSSPIHQVSYEIGSMYLLSEKARIAFCAFNPFQLSFKSADYAGLPSIFRLGFSYQYNAAFLISTELEKNLDFPVVYKIGFEYSSRDIFYARAGISGFPTSCSFGAGIRQNRFMFEFGSAYHVYLGFTPVITIQYDFK